MTGVDDNWLKELDDELDKLKSGLYKLQNDCHNNFKQIWDALNGKANRDDLIALENNLQEKMNDMYKKFLGSFADKNDTKKRLANLEKNVKLFKICIKF